MAELDGSNVNNKGYGKRPLWQWILLYIIIGGLVYFAIYYFFLRGSNANPYSSSSSQSQTNTQPANSAPAVNNAILSTKTDPTLGQYLADPNGKPLYTYGSDINGTSSCTGSCLASWPAYQDKGSTTGLPTNVSIIKRSDNGETQFTYNGKPLYTFVGDANGKITGNGISNFSLARPSSSASSQSTTPASSSSSSDNSW